VALLLLVLCRVESPNQLKRRVWEPGESICAKLVKISGDVHANPGPPNNSRSQIAAFNQGVKIFCIGDRKFKLEVRFVNDKNYGYGGCGYLGSNCGPKCGPKQWKWPTFRHHLGEQHNIFIERKAQENSNQFTFSLREFTEKDIKLCAYCDEKFFTADKKTRHVREKHEDIKEANTDKGKGESHGTVADLSYSEQAAGEQPMASTQERPSIQTVWESIGEGDVEPTQPYSQPSAWEQSIASSQEPFSSQPMNINLQDLNGVMEAVLALDYHTSGPDVIDFSFSGFDDMVSTTALSHQHLLTSSTATEAQSALDDIGPSNFVSHYTHPQTRTAEKRKLHP